MSARTAEIPSTTEPPSVVMDRQQAGGFAALLVAATFVAGVAVFLTLRSSSATGQQRKR